MARRHSALLRRTKAHEVVQPNHGARLLLRKIPQHWFDLQERPKRQIPDGLRA
ncbi:MAG: hypothetical protein ACI9FR_002854 [Cryomorphaceae bacterium]|jgi:hypothetical protein